MCQTGDVFCARFSMKFCVFPNNNITLIISKLQPKVNELIFLVSPKNMLLDHFEISGFGPGFGYTNLDLFKCSHFGT